MMVTMRKRLRSITLVLAFISIAVSAAVYAQTDNPVEQTWLFDGRVRSYELHVPGGLGKAAPLVIALHGRGDTGAGMEAQTHFDDVADREGFLVAYPDGLNNEWNFVRGIHGYDMPQDDTAFLVALIDHISENHPVDKTRVYLAGFSNGGLMVQRAACENPAPFAAFASVSAALFGGITEVCPQTSDIRAPMLLINGTADTNIPWDGTRVEQNGQTIYITYPVSDTLGFWSLFNNCPLDADTTDLPQKGDSPDTQVRLFVMKCPADTTVLLYRIAGGGHNWPGQKAGAPQMGSINRDIDASEEIWKFFAQHQRINPAATPEVTSTTEATFAS
ncbi:MAG: prolyl oligopeptidase family serine peptidase [Chloroflexi bacterium]|nr:prolyl oligopeptidase family serine peptidase [Chloroflexota bacterium]